MANTVIGLFETAGEAQEAVRKLTEKGFRHDDIDLTAGAGNAGTDSYSDTDSYSEKGRSGGGFGDKVENFFSSLFGDDADEAGRYGEVMRRGSTLVTVHAESRDKAELAAEVLDDCGAVDVDERSVAYRAAGHDQSRTEETAIPVVEENLQVGKREVERGGVRVRSRIVEKPVQKELRLREEHVNVERRPVDRMATEADLSGVREGTFEVTERAERPVVQKEARVVEEVAIGKEVQERTETVRDTLRKTEVDVQELDGETKSRGKGTGR